MKLKILFCALLAIGLVFAETEEPEKKKTTPGTTTTTEEPVTTPKPSPKPSPTPSTSSPKPSPTPTPTPLPPKPSPTSPTPTPSSPTPTPTSPAPTPTSPAPTPTTPAPTPTSPAPAPTPPPKEYFWNVTDGHGQNCILAKADISLELKYTNTSKHEVNKKLTIPQNATNTGRCSNVTQVLSILFDGNNTLDFVFTKTDDKEGFRVSSINSTIVVEENVLVHLGFAGLNAFKTKLNTSYDCPWSDPATLEQNDGDRNQTKAQIRVVMHNIQVEAFRNSTNNEFSKIYSCANDSPDIVPIMVGIALAILVAVVLIAYLVGRRNTQAQGYVSM
ncbi:Lysosome-associated membrane glycoprotein (Lamp) [Nesidiocoris tenuis]|uniref:Lysosome-associated membrane glycoprotein 5 n=1 Tax=Nesidiocoris tenuis TaxID=355587 RepID=A0ABN7ACU5_9HEMI|nr:Lysosome-associated membrane glycoprotein (Lamp) [Nesidiocoris tenuis]